VSALGAESGGLAVAAGDLVLKGEQEEVLEGHLLLAGQGEPLREGVEDGRELEAAQHGFEVWRDRLRGHS